MVTKFFSSQALAAFASSQGKEVDQIVCCMWQNLTDSAQPIELIDHIQIRFSDKTMLAIGCNDEGDALDILRPDLSEISAALEKEFAGKIKLHALDASGTSMWKDVISKKLISIQITKTGENYVSDSVMLNFGEEKRTISLNPLDGLLLDYYEE